MSRIISIDPGKHGGIVVLDTLLGSPLEVHPMPVIVPKKIKTRRLDEKGKRITKQPKDAPDWDRIADLLKQLVYHHGIGAAFIENVSGGSQRQGSNKGGSGMFGFGFHAGFANGILRGCDLKPRLIASAVWKKAVGLKTGATKDDSRALAAKLFPEIAPMFKRKKDEGIAEAALIGYAAWTTTLGDEQ